MAWTRSPVVSETRSLNTRVGPAAYESARTSMQSKTSSGIGRPNRRADRTTLRPYPREEVGDVLPCLLPTVEARPMHPNPSDQLVADVDRHEITLVGLTGSAHDQRLDVGRQLARKRAGICHRVPGREVE